MTEFALTNYLIHIAGSLHILGFAITNQIMLRLVLLAGNSTYVAYYYTVPENPLWEAILWSTIFVLINFCVTSYLILRKTSKKTSQKNAKDSHSPYLSNGDPA